MARAQLTRETFQASGRERVFGDAVASARRGDGRIGGNGIGGNGIGGNGIGGNGIGGNGIGGNGRPGRLGRAGH
jgi:hypothetical protein